MTTLLLLVLCCTLAFAALKLFRPARIGPTLPKIDPPLSPPHLRDVSQGNINDGKPTIPRNQVPPPPAPVPSARCSIEPTSSVNFYTVPSADDILPFNPFITLDVDNDNSPSGNDDSFGGDDGGSFSGGGASDDY